MALLHTDFLGYHDTNTTTEPHKDNVKCESKKKKEKKQKQNKKKKAKLQTSKDAILRVSSQPSLLIRANHATSTAV